MRIYARSRSDRNDKQGAKAIAHYSRKRSASGILPWTDHRKAVTEGLLIVFMRGPE
jgi:hypothetical protein